MLTLLKKSGNRNHYEEVSEIANLRHKIVNQSKY